MSCWRIHSRRRKWMDITLYSVIKLEMPITINREDKKHE
jgi:hypothetical protein